MIAAAVLAACSGDGVRTTAPCELLSLDDARELAGTPLERTTIVESLSADTPPEDRVRAEAADEINCIYMSPGTEPGQDPERAAGIQVEEGLYDDVDEFRRSSPGEPVDGLGRAAILDASTSDAMSVTVFVDDVRSFTLVVHGPAADRDRVVELAEEIEGRIG